MTIQNFIKKYHASVRYINPGTRKCKFDLTPEAKADFSTLGKSLEIVVEEQIDYDKLCGVFTWSSTNPADFFQHLQRLA